MCFLSFKRTARRHITSSAPFIYFHLHSSWWYKYIFPLSIGNRRVARWLFTSMYTFSVSVWWAWWQTRLRWWMMNLLSFFFSSTTSSFVDNDILYMHFCFPFYRARWAPRVLQEKQRPISDQSSLCCASFLVNIIFIPLRGHKCRWSDFGGLIDGPSVHTHTHNHALPMRCRVCVWMNL